MWRACLTSKRGQLASRCDAADPFQRHAKRSAASSSLAGQLPGSCR